MKHYKKLISILLTLAVIAAFICLDTAFPGVAYASGNMLVDFSDSSVASKAGLAYSTDYSYGDSNGSSLLDVTADGKQVSSKTFDFAAGGIATDWTEADSIVITMYSAAANGETVNLIFSKSISTINDGYYLYSFNVDWTGWKKLVFSKSSFTASRGIDGWHDINAMYFNIGGWGASATQASTDLYISSVEGVSYRALAQELTGSSIVMYAGEKIMQKSGTQLTLDNAPDYKDEKIFVPLSFFEVMGAEGEYVREGNSLTCGELTLSFADGSSEAAIGAYKRRLTEKAYSKNGEMYVPLEDMCGFLGIPLYTYGRLAVMGSDENIAQIKCYSSYGINPVSDALAADISSPGESEADIQDCEIIIENWLEEIAGNETINSSGDANINSRIKTITNTANNRWAKLIREENSPDLFEGITTESSADMTTTSMYFYQMALGYGTYGSSLYGDEALLEDILYCLEWFYENRYGADEAENNENAWRDRNQFNWHDWRIGTPKNLISTLMIVRRHLTDSQIADYLACYEAAAPDVYSSGANYINACRLRIGAAALKGDTEKIRDTLKKAATTFDYVDDGKNTESQLYGDRAIYTRNMGHGFYKDGSYVFHTLHAMNGTYGLEHLNIASDLLAILEGSAFELPKRCSDNVADWIINSYDTLIYGNRMPRMVLGRGDNPSEISQVKTVVAAAVKAFDSFDPEDRATIGAIIKEYVTQGDISTFVSSVSVADVIKLREIAAADYSGYRYDNSNVFANIDKVMHKRQDWAFALSMSSSRIFNYECINSQNLKGWYLGDGRTELILECEDSLSAGEYWANVDYYRLPGTTVDTQPRQEVSIAQGNEYLSTKDFVGGVEMDEKYTTAAMELESYHNEEPFGTDKGEYGTYAPTHTSDLTAKKAWFAFDDEVFCLGADITASDNNNATVLTVAENRMGLFKGSSVIENTAGAQINTTKFEFDNYGIPTDWSAAEYIKIPIYSKSANGEILNMVFSCDRATINNGYYLKKITVDWTGWKVLTIPKSEFSKAHSVASWGNIHSVYFNIGGWSNPAPLTDTELYISALTGETDAGEILAKVDFTDGAIAQAANMGFSTEICYEENSFSVLTDSGELSLTAEEAAIDNPLWINGGERIGYYFPGDGNHTPDIKTRVSDAGYFELWFNHGVNPSGGTYAYALLPNMTSAETAAYALNPKAEVLANTPEVQAVRHRELGITAIVFWQAGSFEGVTVDKPMIVMLKEAGNRLQLAVTDPTHKLDSGMVTIDRPLLMSEGDSRITAGSYGSSSSFNIDFSENMGATVNAVLRQSEPVLVSAVYTSADGTVLSPYLAHKAEGAVKCTYKVTNLASSASQIRFILAMYSSGGDLQEVKTSTVNLLSGRTRDNVSLTVTPAEDTTRIQAYIWQKGKLKPYDTLYLN
ncbi:MAG: hypothetical protein IJ460_08160 [Clostridia bacterium]|nr:hypothetical protein [Clostridia bacterium]